MKHAEIRKLLSDVKCISPVAKKKKFVCCVHMAETHKSEMSRQWQKAADKPEHCGFKTLPAFLYVTNEKHTSWCS